MTSKRRDEPATGATVTGTAGAVERYLAGAPAGDDAATFARCDAVLALTPKLAASADIGWAFEEARELARTDPREGAASTGASRLQWWRNPGIAWSTAAVLAIALIVALEPRTPAVSEPAGSRLASGVPAASGVSEPIVASTTGTTPSADSGAPAPTVQNITFAPIVISTELAQALAEVRPVVLLGNQASVDSRSLAVMPFTASENAGSQNTAAISASAIYNQVYRQLTAIPGLYLIDPGTAAVYAGSNLTPTEIAEQLGVRGILEGNIDSINGDIHFSLNFTDAASAGSSINRSIARPAAEAAFLQSDIAASVLDALARTPPPESLDQIL